MKLIAAISLFAAFPGLSIRGESADALTLAAAEQAYSDGDSETGHRILRSLTEKNPGDHELAVTCLEKILWKLDRFDATDPWLRYVTTRLVALERIGAISANTRTMRTVLDIEIQLAMAARRFLEVAERVEKLARENPHDLHWKILHAKTARELDLKETRELYAQLRAEADPDHPDEAIRDRWRLFADELEVDPKLLPADFEPIPDGSPMSLMEPDDPDGRWRQLLERAPSDIPSQIDRLMNLSLIAETIVPWRDMSGLTDPARALDLHLLSKPPAQLAKLREIQTESFLLERIPKRPSEAKILALVRRYPWAEGAHEMLLTLANRMLWDGRTQSAFRSFRDLLRHSVDPALLAEAQVGFWTSLAQIADRDTLIEEMAKADTAQKFPWMGETATSTEIRDRLLAGKSASRAADEPDAANLDSTVIKIPPVSPWPSNSHSPSTDLDLQFSGNDVLISGRNILAMFKKRPLSSSPDWVLSQRFPADGNNQGNFRPGYFLPMIDDTRIYSRWGFRSAPDGIAAFERDSGRPLWTSEGTYDRSEEKRANGFDVPIGDPVKADGRLFYLQWSTINNINHNRGRRLNLVCFDQVKSRPAWIYTIAESGLSSDITAALERASSDWAVYGNRVTVHRGAVYSCSNSGSIARSDVRDGHTDWVHFYRKGKHGNRANHLGSDPVIAGDFVICMPRDTERVIALDRRTGRVAWENPLVVPEQAIGVHDGMFLVRGKSNLLALDVGTGEVKWMTPVGRDAVGRAQLIGSSIYVANRDSLKQIGAADGQVVGEKKWDLGEGRPLSFAINQGTLFVVPDQPAENRGKN